MKEYIEREALIKLIEENSETKFDWSECVDIDILRPAIRDIPAADVVPVIRGEWEIVSGVLTPGGDPLKRCPFCKSKESEHLDGVEFSCHWNYCPNCGADMRGVVANDSLGNNFRNR